MTSPLIADRPREELLAAKLRHDHDLGHGRIDPFQVAKLLHLEVVRYPVPDDGLAGQYRPTPDGRGAIFVNSNSSMLRQRFTVAHEIGHALMHTKQAVVDDELERAAQSQPERQADRFAGALLIDREAAAAILERHRDQVDPAVAEVVDVFEVSVPTAIIALGQFDLVSRADVRDFLAQYDQTTHGDFMRGNGRRSRHRPGSGALILDRDYQRRVHAALAAGQLTPERAAELLSTDVDHLPPSALEARRQLLRSLDDDPVFE
jgi:hypothetical protein